MDNYTRNHTRKLFVHARTYQTLDKKKTLGACICVGEKTLKISFPSYAQSRRKESMFSMLEEKKKTSEKVFKSVAFVVENAMFARLLLVEN